MFTGLVQRVGRVASREDRGELLVLVIDAGELAESLRVGDSVAVSGVCLTATRIDGRHVQVDVAAETRRRTTLGGVEAGFGVNLELPLRAEDRLGGHFVQGHVDGVGTVGFSGSRGGDHVVVVEHEDASETLVVEKGSIAIDGVSLTVTRCARFELEVMLIPHTLQATTLGGLTAGAKVNLEYDILAKYMAQLAKPYLGRDRVGGNGAKET